ncbi:MAG: sulfatase-like hydrolase/transferase [Ignavibacteriales bacterium]
MDRKNLIILVKILAAAGLLYLGTEHYDFIAKMKDLKFNHGYPGIIIFIILWLLCTASLVTTMFLPNKFVRMLLAFVIFCATLTGLTYTNISGALLVYDNLYALIENANYADGVLQQYTHELMVPLLISSLSFLIIIPPPRQTVEKLKTKFRSAAAYITAFLPFAVLLMIAIMRSGYGLAQTPIQYYIPALFVLIESDNLSFGENVRNNAAYAHIKENPGHQMNVVLIVDESVRGDYLDINGQNKGITPYLFSHRDRVVNFGLASSGANSSAESNQILRYGPNINDFYYTFKKNAYIWQYAKKAGYKTIFLDAQGTKGKFNNRMVESERALIDEFIYIKGTTNLEKDINIAKFIRENASRRNSKPLFIYALKMGIHFPYDNIVPEDKRLFIKKNSNFTSISRQDLINSYKNAIYYVINPFFRDLLEGVTYENAVIFYTSDHGQNLLDNGFMITHCSTTNVSCYEGLVPLMVISDNERYRKDFSAAAASNFNKASHFNIFPTILSVFGYDRNETGRYHGKTLFDEITEPRKFSSGLLVINRLSLGDAAKNNWNYLPDSVAAPGNASGSVALGPGSPAQESSRH